MKRTRRRRKRYTLVVACAAATIAGLFVTFSWEDLVTSYHALRIRFDSDYLDALLETPPDSRERRALERYARTRRGREDIAERFIGGVDDLVRAREPTFTRVADGSRLLIAYDAAREQIWRRKLHPHEDRIVEDAIYQRIAVGGRLARLYALLSRASDGPLRLGAIPGYECTLLDGRDAHQRSEYQFRRGTVPTVLVIEPARRSVAE